MKLNLRLGEYYALTKHQLKQFKTPYISLLAIITIMCLEARAQQSEPLAVTGKVVSAASGAVIERATVTNKRTRIHTLTNRLGEYRIPARPNDILVYSFVGYVTAEEEIGGREQIVMALDPAENTLEEVEINAGYYTTTRRTSTGNISRITAEEIERQPVTNVLGALIGRMPGVNIVQQDGYPGGSFSVQIRGRNSLRADGNAPLYLIDGVPFPASPLLQLAGATPNSNPLNSINPYDIESIEVLKDADATAIYGSRGANGVILITTKKGKNQSSRTFFQFSSGFSEVPRTLDLLNTPQYMEMRREAFANDGVAPSTANAPDLMLWDTTRYTDWQKTLFGKTATSTDISGSVSGNSPTVSYLVSLSYHTEGMVIPGNRRYRRGSGNISLNHTSADGKFELNSAMVYTIGANHLPSENVVSSAFQLPPNAPEPYVDGQLNWENATWSNPFAYLEQTFEVDTRNWLANLRLSYQILPRLSLGTNVSVNTLSYDETMLFPAHTIDPALSANPRHAARFAKNMDRGLSFEPQIGYRHELFGVNLSYLLGASYQTNLRHGNSLNASGFSSVALMEHWNNADDVTGSTNYSEYRYLGIFGRANLNLSDRYLLNVTFRRDGSSRFGPGKQWGNFGAVGAAWVFSESSFVKTSLPWLSFGKVRASYGVTGSDQIGDYGYLETYMPYNPYLIPTLVPSRLANPDFGWETNRKAEVGFEAGFANNRYRLDISLYRNRSSNQLIGYSLPELTGFPSIQANYPAKVQNEGLEIETSLAVIDSRRLTWRCGFNVTLPYETLLAFPDIENSSYSDLVVGKPLQLSRAYLMKGVDPATGQYTFVDLDTDENISATNDRRILERPVAFYGGLDNSFRFGDFSMYLSLHFSKRTAFDYHSMFRMPGTMHNQPVAVMHRWQQDGDITPIQQFSRGSTTNYSRFLTSDMVFNNSRSYIRLRNVEVSYSIPSAASKWAGLRQASLHVRCQNLLTFSRFKGLYPEANGHALPPLRTILFGFQLSI